MFKDIVTCNTYLYILKVIQHIKLYEGHESPTRELSQQPMFSMSKLTSREGETPI